MAELRGAVVPVIAQYDQKVEIHWRLSNGQIVVVVVTCPEAAK